MAEQFFARANNPVGPMAQRDPAAFRSGIAEGLQDLGRAGQRVAQNEEALRQQEAEANRRIEEIQARRRESHVVADGMGRWAEVQADVATALDEARRNTKPGAPDYEEQADRIVADKVGAFRQTLPDDPEIIDRFGPMLAQYAAQTKLRERGWALERKATFESDNIGKWADAQGNALTSEPQSPVFLEDLLQHTDALFGGLDMDGTTRDAAVHRQKGQFVQQFFDGYIGAGQWQAARAMLDSKQLDDLLSPDDRQAIAKRIGASEHLAHREAEMAASRVRDQARDGIDAIQAKIRGGVVPSSEEMRAVRASAKAAGLDQSELVELDVMDVQAETNRRYAGVPSMTMRRDRDALEQRIAQGKASEPDQIMKAQLDKLVDAADSREAEQYKALIDQGVQGKAAVLAQLAPRGAAGFDIAQKAQNGLGYFTLVHPSVRMQALQGGEDLKANPKLIDQNRASEEFTAQIGLQGRSLNEQAIEGYRTVANAIYAEEAKTQGFEQFEPTVYRRAVNLALGASRGPDGQWRGGMGLVNGRHVMLPDWASAEQFSRLLSRSDFSNARYGDGSPVNARDVQKNYTPVLIGDDRGAATYVFVNAAGQRLKTAKGEDYTQTARPPAGAR
ncbi:hypothetical protein [Stakelama pacifica]|uniref:Uncharacterized protein n=1 Tax=Stakelama pacifica TaxID=517720 RepID=A0A4R6FPF7_9SPHN|nr:hypothetical protein [Stakelama pacifica]TDN82970.1 hypothetical protein EV664_105168 [Stakelama pacifica]GGO95045.1 hypothetical protein GCM10011329_18300 [Stakelama pacifica]